MSTGFDDILQANRQYADSFDLRDHDGQARAGLAVVACMDARVDPLSMLGLQPGDAKIMRNAGGRVGPRELEGLVLAVHLLGVRRVMVIPHTRCAAAKWTQGELRQRIGELSGQDASWQSFLVSPDQRAALLEDVAAVRSYPLLAGTDVEVGGFVYDVETGLVEQVV